MGRRRGTPRRTAIGFDVPARGRRALSITAMLLAASLTGGLTSWAEPPADPGDAAIDEGNAKVEGAATRVGELTSRLAEVSSERDRLLAEVELAMEDANRALVDLETAETEARRAADLAGTAQIEADASAEHIDRVRRRIDEFAAASHQQGTVVGSLSAYFGAESPDELLERVQMLDAISGSHLDLLDELERARTDKVNKDSAARAALADAESEQVAAREAKSAADAALAAAVTAEQAQQTEIAAVEDERAAVEAELASARSEVEGLEAQRTRYEEWQQEQQAALDAVAAAVSVPAGQPAGPTVASGSSTSHAVETVIGRAVAQLGMPYSWGGGNAHGPTRGVRDGGVADAHGDYQKIGFDCSGLMVYAFAGAGVHLPKYSGYQYESGQRVALAQMRRGDMIFWQTSGRIHHVALYLGDGMMVEAPYSGNQVRITPVRYGGIAPYAVRMF